MIAVPADERWLDRFELIAELATGGMATVYLARLSGAGGFQRLAAIKRLHPHLAREPEFIEMFLDEARLAARIHHPNVVPILEIGSSDQGYYLVMEYVEGDTLGRLLARSTQKGDGLGLAVAVRIVLDVLAGLHASHELNDDDGEPLAIVHRDVSPQNVLVGLDGSARLTDFGVARARSKLSTTRTGHLKGKLSYMAPEQARGAKDIDRRADVFAAGIVLWESIAGRRLFKGEGEADTLHKVLHEPIPPVSSAAPAAAGPIADVVARALDRDRDVRYATASAFADALEQAARSAGSLGSHRDVAAKIDATLGSELLQQRETVRRWLARVDSNRRTMPPPSTPPPPMVGADASWDGLPLPPPSSVSTVTSAVISTTPLTPGQAPGTTVVADGPARSGAGPWPWVSLVAVAVLGAVGAGWLTTRSSTSPAAAPTRPAEPAPSYVASAQSASTAEAPPATPDVTADTAPEAEETASSAGRPAASAPGRVVRPLRRPGEPAEASAPPPDDMSRNPYR
ncbi:MAG TPA: protein kinase [Polyangiaceae bacterium]|nr:protein kinase [Polyangiaceae bacterium]